MLLLKEKNFTLVELIVVIVVIGILTIIAIPNISSFREEAEEKAILADARTIQSAVDMFMMKNNSKTPTKDTPTIGNPQVVETYAMKPDYLRSLPKTKKAKFWLDYNHTVWGSTVDAPQNVNYGEGKVTWNSVEGAVTYKIYKTSNGLLSSVKGYKELDFLEEVKPSKGMTQEKEMSSLDNNDAYLVSAVDKYGFEGPVVRVNSPYEGYGDGPDKDLTIDFIAKPRNQKPVAVLKYTPVDDIDTNSQLTWDYSQSTDPEGDEIINVEWKLNNIPLANMPEKLLEGEHTVHMRVQDTKLNWSDWTVVTIPVTKGVLSLSTVSPTSVFGTLTYRTNDVHVLQNGDNVEAYYFPNVCCIQNTLYKDVFNKEGQKISTTSIKGSISSIPNSTISNLDQNGNRYLINTKGQIYIIRPDNTTSIWGEYASSLNVSYGEVYKLSAQIEGSYLYLGYAGSHSSMMLASIDLNTKIFRWKKNGLNMQVYGYTRSEMTITQDHIFVSGLTYYEDSNPKNFLQKFDKKTGTLLKSYLLPRINTNYRRSLNFVDMKQQVWMTETLVNQNTTKMKLYQVSVDSVPQSVVETVEYADAVIQRVDAVHPEPDGTFRIYGLYLQDKLHMVEFK